MIDTHCHLDFADDPREVVDPDLRAMVTVGTGVERNETALELSREFANVWAAVGVHPNEASAAQDERVRTRIEEQARGDRVVAIGETGFDNHWEAESLESQREAFDWQARLARELDLPLILHVRDRQGGRLASAAATEALAGTSYGKGVLHCCNGDAELMATALELGWYVSFAGNLTYRSASKLQEAAREVPADRLLVETDSPFLAPVPHRGKKNRPAFVRHTAEFLAELRGMSAEELEELVDRNAIRFYRLPL